MVFFNHSGIPLFLCERVVKSTLFPLKMLTEGYNKTEGHTILIFLSTFSTF